MRKLICSIFLLSFLSCTERNHSVSNENTSVIDSSAERTIQKDAIESDPSFVAPADTITQIGPRSITRAVLQDKRGMIWLATWSGIIQYENNVFTNITLKEHLNQYHVNSLLEDRSGNIWFGSIGDGAYRYDGKSYTLYTTKDNLAGTKILTMMEDQAGNIWLGTENGLSKFNGTSFINYTTADGLIDNFVTALTQDRKGNIWIGTNGGLHILDGKTVLPGQNSITQISNNKDGTTFHNVRALLNDRNGNVWIASQEGVSLFDMSANKLNKLSTFFANYLFEDKSGMIWLNGGDGKGMALFKYDGKTFNNVLKNYDRKHPFFTQVFGMTEDNAGNIWFGTSDGVCRYNQNSKTPFTFFRE